jgi:hypothetical protein
VAKESHQGLLPTLMHVYVGLDFGVKDEELKNSFAPGLNTQGEGSDESEFARCLHDNVTTVPPRGAPSDCLQFESQPELEKGSRAPHE